MDTPKLLRFRGALYRIAADPPKKKTPQVDVPSEETTLFSVEDAKKQQQQEEGDEPKTPAQEGELPGSKEQGLLEPAEHVLEANKLVAKVAEDAAAILSKAGVVASQKEPNVGLDSDGVELAFSVKEGGLADGSFNNPEVIFDYILKSDSGEGNVWDELKDSVLTKSLFLFKGYSLTQVIFNFCAHHFGAEPGDKYVGDLLEAVSFLQKSVDEVRAESRLEVPTESADAEQLRAWVKDVMVELWENRVDRNSKKEVEDWYNLTQVSEMIRALKTHRYLNGAQEKKILDFLGDPGLKYQEFMKEVENEVKGTAQKQVSLKVRVERKVRELTSHESYSGEIKYGIDDKTGHIVAGINAPYKVLYIFEKSPGGKLAFLESAMNICNQTLIAKSAEKSKDLLSANLSLAEAYKAAVNVEERRNRKPQEEFSKELLKLIQKAKEEPDKGTRTEAPAGENVPADEAGLKQR